MRNLLKQTLDLKTVVLLIVAIGGGVWIISSQWTSVNDRLDSIDTRLTRIESRLSAADVIVLKNEKQGKTDG
jgi:hypothetical protein